MSGSNRRSNNESSNQSKGMSRSHNLPPANEPAASTELDSVSSSAETSPSGSPRRQITDGSDDDDEPEYLRSAGLLGSIGTGSLSHVNGAANHVDTARGVWQMARSLRELEADEIAESRRKAQRKRSRKVRKATKKLFDTMKKICEVRILYSFDMRCM